MRFAVKSQGVFVRKFGVIDGSRTRFALGHGQRAPLFALDHRIAGRLVHPVGFAPTSHGYRPCILLLKYGWEYLDRVAGVEPSTRTMAKSCANRYTTRGYEYCVTS